MPARLLRPLTAAALLFAGCGDKAPEAGHGEAHGAHTAEKPAPEKPAPEKGAEHAAHDHDAPAHAAHGDQAWLDDDPPALTLNNGAKWAMDDHTRAALSALEARLAKGQVTDDAAGYKALGADLDAEIQGLVRGCTMTGPAHDQLHVWLTALIPAVAALGRADNPARADAKQAEIKALLALARQHFE